ncbi:ornithine carbamoyltransferase [Candidatus Omnitrophota bacterium]
MIKQCIKINDFSKEELLQIIDYAEKIKQSPDEYMASLRGKGLGVIFEKPSTRTRVSFEVGIKQLGGFSYYLAPNEIQLGTREELRDVARTLSRYLDAVVLRTFKHETIDGFSKHATIPIINGLSDFSHPCQAFADYLTIKEKFFDLSAITVAYIGDGNNVLHSLVIILSKLGVSMTIATPETHALNKSVLDKGITYAQESGATIKVCSSPQEAVKDALSGVASTCLSASCTATHPCDLLITADATPASPAVGLRPYTNPTQPSEPSFVFA